MDLVNCNLCGSSEGSAIFKFNFDRHQETCCVVRCTQCQLVYVSPRPGPDQIGAFYPPNYQEDMLRIIREGRNNPVIRLGFDMVVRRRTPKTAQKGRLLDVGCSNGAYLDALRTQGWDVEGVEMDGAAADYALHTRKLKITTGDAESVLAKLPSSTYDVVTMWHLLEHLYDPASAIRNVCRILKPGGTLMLEVPNFAAPMASLFKKNWFPLDVPRHLYHFTPQTMRTLLTGAGLKVADLKGVPAPEAIVWSITAARQGEPIDWTRGHRLHVNPLWMGLAFPISWSLAQLNLSDHMAAVAVRP